MERKLGSKVIREKTRALIAAAMASPFKPAGLEAPKESEVLEKLVAAGRKYPAVMARFPVAIEEMEAEAKALKAEGR